MKKKSLLHVPMGEARKRLKAGEKPTKSDQLEIDRMNEELRQVVDVGKAAFKSRVMRIAPWFDWTDYSEARLWGTMSQAYPSEPLSSWMDCPLDQLYGYIDACTPPKKTRKTQGAKPVTKWVRKNRHKYTTNIGSVRAYIEIYGGTLAQLYEIDLKNDLKRNPLSKPKKTT